MIYYLYGIIRIRPHCFELWENKAPYSVHWKDYGPGEPETCEGCEQSNYQSST